MAKKTIGLSKSKPTQQGQKPRAIFDGMRTQAWVADLFRRTEAKGYAALNRTLFGHEGTKKMPTKTPAKNVPKLTWSRYGSGDRTPDEAAIKLVEQHPLAAGARRVLEIGPEENRDNVPLWRLFEEQADFARYLDEMLYEQGIPHTTVSRTQAVLHVFAEPAAWAAASQNSTLVWEKKNLISQSAKSRLFTPTLYGFSLALAGWRYAMADRHPTEALQFLVICLLKGPAEPVLNRHGILDRMRDLVEAMAIEYHLSRQDLPSAISVRKQIAST
ncbi:hypothetical protein [Burkholderia sp. Cy-637]|uniref:hypothetical protein n=1 Tax=Burkholderia sp. Cy-637 TaxID=2608327 RepID=UPI001422D6F2|nr:hypothetical protein [Burkholderia sp. Cy-637]NIF86882.1 hypothetical protein [Burkholderia sp. Cy-637]